MHPAHHQPSRGRLKQLWPLPYVSQPAAFQRMLRRTAPTGRTPRSAQDLNVIRISFDVNTEHAPALRSAVEEISNTVGGRTEGRYEFPIEQALTAACIGLASLRTAVCAAIPAGDPNYRGKK